MNWERIDRSAWNREEYFVHYTATWPTTYSITTKLDISSVKEAGLNLYPTMIYALTSITNRHSEFRTSLDEQGNPGVYDCMCPCYTVFHRDTETFSNIWTEFTQDYSEFSERYSRDVAQYGDCKGIMAKPNPPENILYISMVPWAGFDGFNLNIQKGCGYLLPIFTMGKYYKEGGKTLLPLALQAHHAVCDGFHSARFITELQQFIQELPEKNKKPQ